MPLTQEQFDAYCEQHSLGDAASAFLERVRSGNPSRRITSGTNNVACRFASKKMGCTIQAESQRPELAYVLSFEFDDDILEFYDQCETIYVEKVDRNGKLIRRPYTPDYLVMSASAGITIYECKRDEEVETLLSNDPNWWHDAHGKAHFKPLDAWCGELGFHARIGLSSDIPAQRTQNLQMLADYYGPNVPAVAEEARKQIQKAFALHPWLTRRQLMGCDASIFADDINWMIAHQELWVDFDRQVIADDVRTRIFRDQAAFDSYQAMESTKVSENSFHITTVDFQDGTSVLWDGKPYVIANIGETTLYLQDSAKNLHQLPIDTANQLISDGLLMNAVACDNSISIAAQAKLHESGQRDLAQGIKRLRIMESGLAGETMPRRTMMRLRSQYRYGERVFGSGYLGLVTAISKRGNRQARLHPLVIEKMKDIANEMIFVPDPKSVSACLGELVLRCQEQCLTPPSEKTFRKFVKGLSKEEITRTQKGHKAAHQYEPWHVSLTYETPRHGQRPFDIGHIDHTELGLHFVDEKFGNRSIRAWLTVLIDAFSRKILAWHLSFEKPSYRALMMVIRHCIERHQRSCDYYVVDQGSEFNGIDFETLLARLGAHKKERPASKPRFGNIVERFFGVSEQEFIAQLQANNLFLKNPRGMSPSHDPTRRAIWTLREFKVAWEAWLERYYHQKEHGTLGASPNLVFDEGLRRYGHRNHRMFVFNESMKWLCMPSVDTYDRRVLVDASHGHVKANSVYYHAPILKEQRLHRKRIEAKHDPYDISRLHVFIDGHWIELRSAHAGEIEGYSVHDLHIYTEELKANHGNAYCRRKNNQVLLASFLRTMKAKEDDLNTIRSLAEKIVDTKAVISNRASVSSSTPEKHVSKPKFDVNAHWGITLKQDGESQWQPIKIR